MTDQSENQGNDNADRPAAQHRDTEDGDGTQHGRHELPPGHPRPGRLRQTGRWALLRRGRSQLVFGALAMLLCLVLGVAI
ncbi:MAG TPA: hypothetical protein VE197_15030, partial [Mycobacterium sp.]|nr:hypothetical protein [Mycobacterium sp.]